MPKTDYLTANCKVKDVIKSNNSHLEHLYHEMVIANGETIGVVDIYLDAPDYHLVFDEAEGFTCLDDIARVAVYYCRCYKQNPKKNYIYKIETLLKSILYLQAENGYFYNFIFPDLTINKTHVNSTATPNFWSWRAMWALSEIQIFSHPRLQYLMPRLNIAFNQLVNNLAQLIDGNEKLISYNGIKIPKFIGDIGSDQIAVVIASLTNFYKYSPDIRIKNLILKLGNGLLKTQVGDEKEFPHFAFLSWKNLWHAWGNCQSRALLYSGEVISNNDFINAAINEVQYFYPYLIKNNFLSKFYITKKNGKLECADIEQFPQIAYDIRSMVFGAIYAYRITHDAKFANIAASITMWLFGRNAANSNIYESSTGICYDGIDSFSSVNKNSGAESTIESLLILTEIDKYPFIKNRIYELLKTK